MCSSIIETAEIVVMHMISPVRHTWLDPRVDS